MRKYSKTYLVEDRTYKNMKRARDKYLKPKGYSDNKCKEANDFLKRTIPNVKNLECHFIEGITRMYADGELDDSNVRDKINQVLGYLTTTDAWNEFGNTPDGRNLNGMSAQQLVSKYKDVIKDAKNADEDNLSKQDFGGNNGYDIVLIDSFEKAKEYAKYTSWCVTQSEEAFENYTKGGVFYFCLKDGFENVKLSSGANTPLDEYGLSMIAVSIYPDGQCNTITCRWNHDNGGNDHIMTTKELSNVIGENFYDIFKPLKTTMILGGKEYVIGFNDGEKQELLDEQGNNVLGEGVVNFEFDERVTKFLGCDVLKVETFNGENYLKFQDGASQYILDEWYSDCRFSGNFSKEFGAPCFEVYKKWKYNYVVCQDGTDQCLFDRWFDHMYFQHEMSNFLGCPCFEVATKGQHNLSILQNRAFHYLLDEWVNGCLYNGKLSEQLDLPSFLVNKNDKYNFLIIRGGVAQYLFEDWFDECWNNARLGEEFGVTCVCVEKNKEYNYAIVKNEKVYFPSNKWYENRNNAEKELVKFLERNDESRVIRLSNIITEMVIRKLQ